MADATEPHIIKLQYVIGPSTLLEFLVFISPKLQAATVFLTLVDLQTEEHLPVTMVLLFPLVVSFTSRLNPILFHEKPGEHY